MFRAVAHCLEYAPNARLSMTPRRVRSEAACTVGNQSLATVTPKHAAVVPPEVHKKHRRGVTVTTVASTSQRIGRPALRTIFNLYGATIDGRTLGSSSSSSNQGIDTATFWEECRAEDQQIRVSGADY